MVNYDAAGEIAATRNFNDPMIALAEKLARAGVRLPVPDPDLMAQFHRAKRSQRFSFGSPNSLLTHRAGAVVQLHGTAHLAWDDAGHLFEIFTAAGQENPFSGVVAQGADALEPAIAKVVGARCSLGAFRKVAWSNPFW